ncbi:MAG: hypothetical protein HY719_09230, partial [Planctomycetes bacterium]|nr:hypothetical protein [Planctomycetota bacterium]
MARLLLFVLLLAPLAGCGTGFFPFFHASREEEETPAFEALSPLIAGEDGEAGRQVRFSPFFSYLEDPERDRTQLDVLYPLLSHRTDGKSSATRLVPLAYYKNLVRPDGTYDWDAVLLPFLFFGDSNDADREGAYLGVMPFGGTLKGFLGKEYIDFVLFPAYY